METPSIGTDSHAAPGMNHKASVSASEIPLPASPALEPNKEADVDVKLAVDADDDAGSVPPTDVESSSLPKLEHLAPPVEGDELPFPSPLLPRNPAVTPAEYPEAPAVAPSLSGQDPSIVQKPNSDAGKQQAQRVADYFSMPTRVVIIPGTPHEDGAVPEPLNPSLLDAPHQRSDSVSVSAKDRGMSYGSSLAPNPSVTAALRQPSDSVSKNPSEIPSQKVNMIVSTAPTLNSTAGASDMAPTVLIMAAADRVSLGQQGAPKLQTLPEEGDLDHGSAEAPGDAKGQPKPASWAEEVLQLVASQQAILVGGPGHTITVTNGKDALAAVSSGEQPELSELTATRTAQDLPKDLSLEDESATPGRGRLLLRKVRDKAQSLTRGHSRATTGLDQHPGPVPDIRPSEVSEAAGTLVFDCPVKAEEVLGDPTPKSDSAAQGTAALSHHNVGDPIPSATVILELPKDPSSIPASAQVPPKKWRLFTGGLRNTEPSAAEDGQANLAGSGDEDAPAVVDSTTQSALSGSTTTSFDFTLDSSQDDDSGVPGRGRLLARKARNAALRRSVLVVMLGHQLAAPTKDALEVLARGEVWVGPQAV